jgi:hypothetical protein
MSSDEDEESEDEDQRQQQQQANKQGRSLMMRVEEISEHLRAMLGTSNVNDRCTMSITYTVVWTAA